jgi:hypothetical protein
MLRGFARAPMSGNSKPGGGAVGSVDEFASALHRRVAA